MPRWLTWTLAVLVLLAVALALAAPIGPMPGFRIGGAAATPPADWSATTLPDEVRLATHAGVLPHVVIIWVVEAAGRLYLVGEPGSTWTQGATANPDVLLRVGDDTYAMRATRLSPGRVDIVQAYVDRYRDDYPDVVAGFPPLEQFAAGAAIFELAPR